MATLSFSLAPEALFQLHDALICLAKFHETVAIEAEYDLLRLSVLNSSKTAYSAFVFDADSFFESYSFGVARGRNSRPDKFCCEIYLKALLSVFKGRTSGRDKDTAVERCEVELHEETDETECKLVVRMVCGLGVIKSYKLIYEPATVNHAIFDRSRTTNQWSIDPKFLREITDHFSPSAEQLDIYSEGGKAIFTSFTTKITDGKEILRQPVHTSVAIDKKDFDHFLAEDNLHIAIALKDFKAAIAHAETAGTIITARYTRPCRPLQLAYGIGGVKAEFTLMTRGESGGDDAPASSRAPAPELSARQTPAPVHFTQTNTASDARQMPPPRSRSIRPLTGTSTRGTDSNMASQRPPPPINFDSLFVPADDDRQWDVPNEDEDEEAQDVLGWDATADQETFNASLGPGLKDNEPSMQQQAPSGREEEMGIPPTQRMSQVNWPFTLSICKLTLRSCTAWASSTRHSLIHCVRSTQPSHFPSRQHDHPTRRAPSAQPNNLSTSVTRQRDLSTPLLHVALRISVRSTISMFTPSKSHDSPQLTTIVAPPGNNRRIILMYIDSMPTGSDTTESPQPIRRRGATSHNIPLVIRRPKHRKLPRSLVSY
ncbi:Rad9-domain-containing protein [Aspergillus floccosus]